MGSEQSQSNGSSKLTYSKPMVRKIELLADEVLATGCKLASGVGGQLPTCLQQACSSAVTGS